MTSKPTGHRRLTDGELGLLAALRPEQTAILVAGLRTLSSADCNTFCRKMARQLLDELAPYLTDQEDGLCRSIASREDRRRLSAKRIWVLHHVCRNAARRALVAKRCACRFMAAVMPANTLPL